MSILVRAVFLSNHFCVSFPLLSYCLLDYFVLLHVFPSAYPFVLPDGFNFYLSPPYPGSQGRSRLWMISKSFLTFWLLIGFVQWKKPVRNWTVGRIWNWDVYYSLFLLSGGMVPLLQCNPLYKCYLTSLYNPMGISSSENRTNADALATAVAVSDKLSFVSDPGVLCLLPASLNL